MTSNLKVRIHKVVASLTMAATVMSLSGFAVLAPVAAQTAGAVAPADYGLHEGDTIRASDGDIDIYIVNQMGYKRLFVNPAIFNLYGHLGWDKVKVVSSATRDAFVTSGLFRNCETNDQKVYGLEVNSEDTATLHWVNVTGAQAVAEDPNFFAKVFCINTNEQNLYQMGSAYSSLSQIPPYGRGGVTPTPVGGNVSVSLAADNPVANTLIAGQAAGDLAHFVFSGSGTVTSVTLQRLGVSADTTLSNVYLYSGTKRLTDAATVSSGKVTFNDAAGLFMVNGSTTISVKSDVAGSTSGQTVGVQLTGFTVGGTTTAASLSGNMFTIASAPSDFATVAVGTSTPSSTTTLDPQNDYTMWQNIVSVTNHDVWLKSLQLRNIGSTLPADLRNFRLYLDGVQVGSTLGQADANNYIVFDLSASPVLLKTGSRTLKLIGDVVGGSNRNFTISLRQKPDLYVVDSQYGQAVLSTGTFPASTGEQDINQGTMTVTKTSDSPAGDVIKDSASTPLARFKFEAHGESMKIENLRVAAHTTGHELALRNGALFAGTVVGSLTQVGSTATIWEDSTSASNSTAYTEYNLGSSLVVVPGTPQYVEIRADIYDASGTNNTTASDTIRADIIAGSSNVQRLTSLNYISCMNGTGCSATSAGQGNALTVKTGSFTAAKYTGYANQNVVTPRSAYKIGSFTLTAASSEDVTVNTITVDAPLAVSPASYSAGDLTDMYLVVKNDAGSVVYTSSPKSTVSGTASNSFSVNFTMPKTKTYQIEVYGSLASTLDSNDSIVTNLDAAGTTVSSATSVTASEATGQTVTGANGSLSLNNGASPAAALVGGGATVPAYVFTLQPQYDNFTLTEATFKLSSTVASSTNAVGMLDLYDGTTLVGSSPITTLSSAAFGLTGLNVSLPQGGASMHTFTAKVRLSSVGVGANDTGGAVKVQLSHLKYQDSNGNITTAVVDPTTYTGNQLTAVAAYPSFSNQTLPSTVLSPVESTLFKTQVTANNGPIAWRKVVFTVSVTANPTITNFKLFENGAEITSLASATYTGTGLGAQFATASHAFSRANAGSGKVIFQFNSDRIINSGSSAVLELKGTVAGSNVAGDSISTSVANTNGTTFVASDDVVSLGGSNITNAWASDVNPTFLWSDLSAASHASTTDDWMGDALITGIGAAQALYQ